MKEDTGSQALLYAIFKKFGGPTALRRRFFPELHKQCFINWKIRGHVPLEMTAKVAAALKISPWGLNYNGLKSIFMGQTPSWEKVVGLYSLSKDTVKKILALKQP